MKNATVITRIILRLARLVFRPVAAAVLVLAAGTALAFAVELEFDPGGLDVLAEAYSDGRLALVRVSNGEDFALRCQAVFRNGPEMGRARQVIVAASDQATLSWAPKRTVVRLRVELHCERHD